MDDHKTAVKIFLKCKKFIHDVTIFKKRCIVIKNFSEIFLFHQLSKRFTQIHFNKFLSFAGDYLLDRYDGATEVKVNRRGRLAIRDPKYSLPTANDLVYLDDSPNYCFANATLGSLGLILFLNDLC